MDAGLLSVMVHAAAKYRSSQIRAQLASRRLDGKARARDVLAARRRVRNAASGDASAAAGHEFVGTCTKLLLMHLLDEATALERVDTDRFQTMLSEKYWGYTAAHGGYLAALLLRAMQERCGDPTRHARSLTVHFLKGPERGLAEVHTEVLRSGGRLTSATARLVQGGEAATFAIAAFGSAFDAPAVQQLTMPEAPQVESLTRLTPSKVEIDHRFEHRQCFGAAPFTGGERAQIGGYSRLEGPRPIDALTLTLLCDAWWPALFTTLTDKKQAGACPTIDLTIHFRAELPLAGDPADFVLVEVRTDALAHGYLDESCRIWSKDGRLLAQTVQHAVRLLPRK